MQRPTIDELLNDPSVSNWLKKSLAENLQRDPVDAANDAALLAQVLDERANTILMAKS